MNKTSLSQTHIQRRTIPAEVPEDMDISKMEHGFTMEVLWAAFPVTFPLSAHIIVRLPYRIEEIALHYVQPGYVISGEELHWTFRDIEPTREDNLSLEYFLFDWDQSLVARNK